ncbi:MAG: 4'-phosphopantetheinyl transferase superfamily protein [Ferruginibacter sp.]|nr:4'-phosphopantetheinyl transferase superfamily protein [Ferruginibacter sp.]
MPLVYQQNINVSTKLGVWHIAEPEEFFLHQVPLQREITHPNKRLQHLAGRYLLKELYPDFPYELIRIAGTRKPFLENEAYHFSISHCGAYAAVIAGTHHRVGVDVELISGKVDYVKHKFLSEKEQQLLKGVPLMPWPVFNDKLLTAAWSIKETLYKWQGSSEVDFKKHLVIVDIIVRENEGVANCTLLKDGFIDLPVHFLFFNENCISWVLSEVF